jgi:hypothetical protein
MLYVDQTDNQQLLYSFYLLKYITVDDLAPMWLWVTLSKVDKEPNWIYYASFIS